MAGIRVIAPTDCALGEGPLWHPERREIFWFDIKGRALHACDAEGGGHRRYDFDEEVSAAAWVDRDRLLIASQTGLWRLHLPTADCLRVWELEAGNEATRSNDGRADPAGGFWIGTMGRHAEKEAGSIWRVGAEGPVLYRDRITVPNAICFAPDGRSAYWTDTPGQVIWRQPLDPDTAAPAGDPEPFVDLTGEAYPDGAVCDAEGYLWNAHWDGWRVVRYAPDGSQDRVIELPVQRPTCPAFGGEGLTRLFVTSARIGLDDAALAKQPDAGALLALDVDVPGLPETRFAHLDGRPDPAMG